MASLLREELVDLAEVAEQEGRFDEMVEFIICIAKMEKNLTLKERYLLSLGYKYLMGAECTRKCVTEEIKPNEGTNASVDKTISAKSQHVEFISQKMIEIIEELLMTVSNAENSVFYNTLKGDCYRQLAKFKDGSEKRKFLDQALKAYKIAAKTAEKSFPPTNKGRLYLAICLSTLFYEIEGSSNNAYNIAKQAFDEAVLDIQSLDEEGYQDYKMLMKVMKDNIRLWKSKKTVGTDHSVDGTSNRSTTYMARVHHKCTSKWKTDFKGKVIYMSSQKPIFEAANQESGEEQDFEPTDSDDSYKNSIQTEVQQVKSKLGRANDEREKRKLQGQLAHLAFIVDILD